MIKSIVPLIVVASFMSSVATAGDFSEKIKQAMQSEHRTEAEQLRDRNRKPVQTLEFFGIKDNMSVIELIPGGGWYTKLLAPALRDNGKLYVSIGTAGIEKSLLKNAPFNKTIVINNNTTKSSSRKKGNAIDFGVKDIDAVLTFRNYHNFSVDSRTAMNVAAFDTLKSGGIYGVVDHTRRHMQQDNDENGRRVDPVLAIKEIQAAGFVLVDYATLHYRTDDELRFEVGRKTVRGNTDRFTLLFKKP